jgi:hypothetical protein
MKLFGWLKKFLFISVIAFSIIQNPTQAMEENSVVFKIKKGSSNNKR